MGFACLSDPTTCHKPRNFAVGFALEASTSLCPPERRHSAVEGRQDTSTPGRPAPNGGVFQGERNGLQPRLDRFQGMGPDMPLHPASTFARLGKAPGATD